VRALLAAVLLCAPASAGLAVPDLTAPAPEGWRQSIEGSFSLFLPPSVKRAGPKTFDSIAGEYSGGGVRLRYDHGYYVKECADGELARVGGRLVRLQRSDAPDGGPRTLIACFEPSRRGAKRLTVTAESLGETAAEEAELAVFTIRFSKP
jgi:hypothetical protein